MKVMHSIQSIDHEYSILCRRESRIGVTALAVLSHHVVTDTVQSLDRDILVAQYVRMSAEHQRYSTESQAPAVADYAQAHGMRIVRTYEDSGKSGLNLKGRSALQALPHDVKLPSPGFQAILVYDVSRWGRFPAFFAVHLYAAGLAPI